MTIREIEKLTFARAKSIAIETVKIKEHDCFFVELGEHFGYSVLVFKNGRHIYHANNYELLHSLTVEKNGKEGLWQYYIKSLNKKLFTDSELLEPIGSYEEYNRKDYFLRNLWIMRYDYISAFAISDKNKMQSKKVRKHILSLIPYHFAMLQIKKLLMKNRSILNICKKSVKNYQTIWILLEK